MSEAIRLSVAETNKLRAQLGLPLLPTGESSSDQSDVTTGNKTQSKKSLSIQETNRLRRSLGLGLLDEDISKASTYRNDASENRYDRAETGPNMVSSEPKDNRTQYGMKIGHSAKKLSQLKEGDVFTLEDKDILDESDDVFVNADLVKQQKQESIDREKLKQGSGFRSTLLAFDEESDPEDDLQHLRIEGSTIQIPEMPVSPPEPAESGNITRISGLFDDLVPELKPNVSRSKTVKFKKSKGSSSRKRTNDEYQEIITNASEMITSSFALDEEDSDDIEASLAKARQKKAKKRSQMSSEEIAAEARTHHRLDVIADLKDGLVFDQTKDFLENLSTRTPGSDHIQLDGNNITGNDSLPSRHLQIDDNSVKRDNANADTVSADSNSGPLLVVTSTDNSSPVINSATSAIETIGQSNEPDESEATCNPENQEASEIEAPKFNSVLSTLKYLRQTATMTSEAEKKANRFKHQKLKEQSIIRMKILAQERIIKEELLKDVHYNRLTPEEKEKIYDDTLNRRLIEEKIISDKPRRGDRYRTAQGVDELENYNPQVHIRHKDENGQVMDQKQAWKALSHRYHGLAPKKVKRTKMKSRAERTIN